MEELEKNETSTQAEENTVSLASAQALADALAKIEVYTPTTWVDNSSPDIDAEHLNKPEQAIKRVTDALNSAVDVIKDLQSQITKNSGAISDVNNNLSGKRVVDQFTVPSNTKITYAYKYGNMVSLTVVISNIKDGWNTINLTTKYELACPAIASISKTTIADKNILASCTFNGTNITVISNADFIGDLSANFILLVK